MVETGEGFVLTSVSEGLSLAMMEAMASGLPAIVPDTGDLGDLVKDHVNGYLLRDPSASHTPTAYWVC